MVLTSNMISRDYVTGILAFCNVGILSQSFVYTFSLVVMNIEGRTMNTEHIGLRFLVW